MTEIPTNSISLRSRLMAGAIFFLAWLSFIFVYRALLSGFLPIFPTFVNSIIRLLMIAGLIGAPLIGFWLGQRWWHKAHIKKEGGRESAFRFLPVAAGIIGAIIGGSIGVGVGIFIGGSMNQGLGAALGAAIIGLVLGAILGAVVAVRMVSSQQI